MANIEKITKAVAENQITMVLLPGESYNHDLRDLMGSLSETHSMILYVTLNRPCQKIIKEFEAKDIDVNRFHFIDTVSKEIKSDVHIENCDYIMQKELTDLSITLGQLLATKKPQIFVFDSFHTMKAYEENDVITRFAHDLIARLGVSNCKTVLPIVSADQDSPLTRDLEMFVDEVIKS